jgi:hypothetical protein
MSLIVVPFQDFDPCCRLSGLRLDDQSQKISDINLFLPVKLLNMTLIRSGDMFLQELY